MQTHFTLAQLADPTLQDAEKIIRTCVHCGFCLATCPTYVLLGDERDSPRGRIYLIKEMLEKGSSATATITRHIDRCLSCFSCMTTCPSGVDYRTLIDHARVHIERTFRRSISDRLVRWWLAKMLPNPNLFRLALIGARALRIVTCWVPAVWMPPRIEAMLGCLPQRVFSRSRFEKGAIAPADGERRGRVALLAGCVQHALAPQINEATVRLLNRHGIEVVVVQRTNCCGALAHHLGRELDASRQAEANIRAWTDAHESTPFDAILVNASGCGDMVKNYQSLFVGGPENSLVLADRTAQVASLVRDISEFMYELGIEVPHGSEGLSVAYHPACALQHGQRVIDQPRNLLTQAGFTVVDVPDGHLCCGSAGTYSLLQPKLAGQLAVRKATAIDGTGADLVATGNIGCMIQIARASHLPVVHTVELLDWATGGPKPAALSGEAFCL
jgi:glycolate oxidase iron-sulfur subunit